MSTKNNHPCYFLYDLPAIYFGISIVLVKNVSAAIQVAFTSDGNFELMKITAYK